jgi:arginine/ornithine N-succinyltransferase beta subunit
VHNLTSAAAASLRQGVASLTEQVGGLQARLARTLAEFEDVGGEVEQLEALVVDEVRAGREGVAG